MGRWTAESTGMSVLRPIALKQLKDPEKKSRIWSSELEAWGFFSKEGPSKRDAFLLWCSISPGDRIMLDFFGHHDVHTVIGIWQKKSIGASRWTFKMINSAGAVNDFDVEEGELFRQAWGLL